MTATGASLSLARNTAAASTATGTLYESKQDILALVGKANKTLQKRTKSQSVHRHYTTS
jgi:hypothetical protein